MEGRVNVLREISLNEGKKEPHSAGPPTQPPNANQASLGQSLHNQCKPGLTGQSLHNQRGWNKTILQVVGQDRIASSGGTRPHCRW